MRRTFYKNRVWIFLVLMASPVAFAQMQTVEDHEALADRFEKKAKVYESLIADHETMVGGYQSTYRSYDDRQWDDDSFPSPQLLLNRMEKHCNRIIEAATSLREDMLEFAKLHRMRAEKMQAAQ